MRVWLALFGLWACNGDDPETPAADDTDVQAPDEAPPPCGDGDLDPGEACDEGTANSDTVADACRTTCLLAACGDGVVDGGEACDDGDLWGGDGCDPQCQTESGPFEREPNDVPYQATPMADATQIRGALTDRKSVV